MIQNTHAQKVKKPPVASTGDSSSKKVRGMVGSEQNLNYLLQQAKNLSLMGDLDDAQVLYRKAVRLAGKKGIPVQKAQAMRGLGKLLWIKGQPRKAMSYYKRSLAVSKTAGDIVGSAKVYNCIGTLYFSSGNWKKVEEYFTMAVDASKNIGDVSLMAHVYNNLGAMSNILGNWKKAIFYYEKAIDNYRRLDDMQGLARTNNNIGLTYRDMGKLDKAVLRYKECIRISEEEGNVALRANCTLNEVQILIELSQLDEASKKCDQAYVILSDMGEATGIAEAMMLYGVIHMRNDKWILAEKHFKKSLKINKTHKNLLGEAECYREMAILYKNWGKNKKTLECLGKSFSIFRTLKAIKYLQDIDKRIDELEELTFMITRDMGAAVESMDTYTFGHSQRVAHYAVEIARKMRLEDDQLKSIMVAAYLHDVGKMKVKKEILQKTRKLAAEEFYIIQKHPQWGIELLEGIEFPWEVKSLILHHQEKWNGAGYPEALEGENIPLGSRIIAAADIFDALTTDRPYRKALSIRQAVKILKTEAGASLDPSIVQKFLLIIKKKVPMDFERSLSAMPLSSFLKLWGGNGNGKNRTDLLKRGYGLSRLIGVGKY